MGFRSKCHTGTLLSGETILKTVKIWQSYEEFRGGNFLRHGVVVNRMWC